jgi:hypothetical protein
VLYYLIAAIVIASAVIGKPRTTSEPDNHPLPDRPTADERDLLFYQRCASDQISHLARVDATLTGLLVLDAGSIIAFAGFPQPGNLAAAHPELSHWAQILVYILAQYHTGPGALPIVIGDIGLALLAMYATIALLRQTDTDGPDLVTFHRLRQTDRSTAIKDTLEQYCVTLACNGENLEARELLHALSARSRPPPSCSFSSERWYHSLMKVLLRTYYQVIAALALAFAPQAVMHKYVRKARELR